MKRVTTEEVELAQGEEDEHGDHQEEPGGHREARRAPKQATRSGSERSAHAAAGEGLADVLDARLHRLADAQEGIVDAEGALDPLLQILEEHR